MMQIFKMGRPLWCHLALLMLSALIFVASYAMPMLSTPGFESANLYVLFLGPWLALIAAFNEFDRAPDFRVALKRELAWLLIHLTFIFALLYARSLSVISCSQGFGLGAFFVILVPPLVLNVTLGTLLACLSTKKSYKFFIWLLFYISYFAVKLHFWWHDSPFRFLSDISLLITTDLAQGGEITPALIAFRVATLGFALALMALGLALWPLRRGRIQMAAKPVGFFVLFFVLGFGACFLHKESLKAIGKTKKDLAQDYQLILTKNNISVHANGEYTTREEAQAILDEALFYQELLRKRLGVISNKNIVIWLHSNDDEKMLYSGAKNVHFAQPQHREIHVSGFFTPNNIVGHELAHIYVGEYSSTYWKLPGRYFVVPNLALTEGLAMVLTPELALSNNLDLIEQAQSLYQAQKGIDIKQLFSLNPLNFSRSDFRASYIFAGAFLQFYLENIPEQQRYLALQKIARAGSLEGLFDSKAELERALILFNSKLAEPVDGYALLWAERNFGALGILMSNCSKSHQEKYKLFWQHISNLDIKNALVVLSNFNLNQQINLGLRALKKLLDKDKASEALLLEEYLERPMRESHDARLVELYFEKLKAFMLQKNYSEAQKIITHINPLMLAPSAQRQLIIQRELLVELLNRESLSIDPNYERLLNATQDLLSKATHNSLAATYFAHELGAYAGATRALKMAEYLYARLLMRAELYEEALVVINNILSNGPGLEPSLLDESLAMKAESLFALKRFLEAREIYTTLLAQNLSAHDRVFYKNRLERILFYDRQN